MAGKMNAVRVNCTIPQTLLDELDSECEKQRIPRSTYIQIAIQAKLRADRVYSDMPGMMAQAGQMISFLKTMEEKGMIPVSQDLESDS